MFSKSNMLNKDYIQILKYYKVPIPSSKRLIQKEGERILSLKLCKCIKKIDATVNNEPRAIGICTKTIFNRKGLTRGKFKCKGKRYVNFNKTRKLYKK
jgi:hypothetical protein